LATNFTTLDIGNGSNRCRKPGPGLTALLIDDERLARAALRRMLGAHPDVLVSGEASNAEQARAQIRRLEPDVIFLDVEMPGTNGLEMLDGIRDAPLVVFTTAYSEHAVRAFEIHALDYLLKPIPAERLSAALDRVRKVLLENERHVRPERQILLRDGQRTWRVAIDQILLLQSEGNYTRIYFEGNCPLIYSSLNALGARLDPAMFFRVSRSHIVNLRKIVSLEPHPEGGLAAVVGDGLRVQISRRRSRTLRRHFRL
jgi:two-component system LytT family response regulator